MLARHPHKQKLRRSKTFIQKFRYFEYVKIMHPDRNPNADQDKFKELTSAYNLLSNAKKRKEYDQYRDAASYGGGANSSQYSSNQNPFGQDYNPFGKGGNYQQNRGPNKYYYKYEYRQYQNPEEVKKEFEEFLK